MSKDTIMKKQKVSFFFKGFEILIQETNDGVIVDVYEDSETPSAGLLGSTYVFFNKQDELSKQNEESHDYYTG